MTREWTFHSTTTFLCCGPLKCGWLPVPRPPTSQHSITTKWIIVQKRAPWRNILRSPRTLLFHTILYTWTFFSNNPLDGVDKMRGSPILSIHHYSICIIICRVLLFYWILIILSAIQPFYSFKAPSHPPAQSQCPTTRNIEVLWSVWPSDRNYKTLAEQLTIPLRTFASGDCGRRLIASQPDQANGGRSVVKKIRAQKSISKHFAICAL